MKKVICLVMTLCVMAMMLSGLSTVAFAAETQGSCGDNAIWTYDEKTGILEIGGSGDMKEFLINTPWDEYRDSVKKVVVNEGITSLSANAFHFCRSLTDVTLPSTLATVGRFAFYCDSGLSELTIPNSVKKIGKRAFYGCTALENLNAPESLEVFGEEALLNSGYYNKAENWDNGKVLYFGNCLVTSKTSNSGDSGTYTIKDGTKIIAENAFYGCTGLTEVNLPESLVDVNYAAFYKCRNIKKFNFPANVKRIGGWAFYQCGSASEVTFPDGLLSIGGGCFHACGVKELYIPDSVTEIGVDLFYDSKIQKVRFPSSITVIPAGTFCRCAGLKEISIPAGVNTVGFLAFLSCNSLTDIYYGGDEAAFNKIVTGAYNECFKNATVHYNSYE